MLREPVSRTISMYYERIFPTMQVSLNELPLEDLSYFLQNFYGSAYSAYRDEGLVDAACKMMCSLNVHKGHRLDEIPGTLSPPDLALAVSRLGKTVVGLTHRWEETKAVIRFWFPWINTDFDNTRGNIGRGSLAETYDTLRVEHRLMIETSNKCDRGLYEEAVQQFERQLEVAGVSFT